MGEPIMVSVVVPAFNAAATIRRTLDSLLAQTFSHWEAAVVDDGSSDDTSDIVAEYERSDPRIVLVRQLHAGASASRNTGLARARHPWIYFLDSDDWIHPQALERLTNAVRDDANVDAAVCGWALVTSEGLIIQEGRCPASADLFPILARRCAFVIHACLVRRDLVDAAGRLDPAIHILEDWLLWQRVARLGARFTFVNETLAFYVQHQYSLSSDPVSLFNWAMKLIEIGHGPDERIPRGPHAAGRPAFESPGAKLNYLCWVAGMMLARERDPNPLISQIASGISQLEPSDAAESLHQAVPAALGRSRDVWDIVWPTLEPHIDRFLERLELHMAAAGHARATRLALERRIVDDRLTRGLATSDVVALGALRAQRVEITSPIVDIPVEHVTERLRVHVALLGEPLGVIELPVIDESVRAEVLRDSIADRFAWIVLGRFFARNVYPQVELRRDGDGWSAWRAGKCLAAALPDEARAQTNALHDAAGWSIFLEELWDPRTAEASTSAGRAAMKVLRWLEVTTRSANDWAIVEVSGPPRGIVTSRPSVSVILVVGGSPLDVFEVPVDNGRLSSDRVRHALTDASGYELCRVAVREALIGTSWVQGGSLRQRLARRAAERAADRSLAAPIDEPQVFPPDASFAPGWRHEANELTLRNRSTTVIARRAARPLGGSASRVATLPGSVAELACDVERATGTPIVHFGDGEPAVVYAPSVLWRPSRREMPDSLAPQAVTPNAPQSGMSSVRHEFEVVFARKADPWQYTSAYEVHKYEQTLALLPASPIQSALELGCAEGHFTVRLAARVQRLIAADVSDIALERTAERCRELTNVGFRRLDIAHDDLPGLFDLIVCSEMLYFVGNRDGLGRVAQRIAAALAPGGVLVTAHANLLADDPDRTGYDWDLPFGARTIIDSFTAVPSLRLERELRTPLYRIAAFRATTDAARPPEITEIEEVILPVPSVAAHIVWNGRSVEASRPRAAIHARPTMRVARLPILMYHRIATSGAAERGRWRVTPEMFERQLRYLRECGFESTTLDEWRAMVESRRPSTERRVLFTFDDGYTDFAEHAWPILRRHHFGAMLMVVTRAIGGTNSWDRAANDEELLDWPSISRLHKEGVEIGSHSASHPRMTGLTPSEIAREALEGRAMLEDRLQAPVSTFAYPFGDEDEAVRHIIGGAGYAYGLSCRQGLAGRNDPWLALPRIEVSGFDDLHAFISKLAP